MRKSLALLWLGFTLLPFGYFAYFIVYVMNMWGIETDRDFHQQQAQFQVLFRIHIAAMVLIWMLIASYVTYIFRTQHVPKDKKALWAVVLFMGSIVAMPVFWFIYVWRPAQLVRSGEQVVTPDRREGTSSGDQ